ncbi:hypothetical protein AF72_04080 [Xylella taiwanensis]|uniref:Uncharacterized protein n=1 Tax=Xylella taiwanensis TaxID=1444770 RepID=Z9JK09_9GAMM|nr:hypothetical protein AF72_04080 [Xylella taiwanensis]
MAWLALRIGTLLFSVGLWVAALWQVLIRMVQLCSICDACSQDAANDR